MILIIILLLFGVLFLIGTVSERIENKKNIKNANLWLKNDEPKYRNYIDNSKKFPVYPPDWEYRRKIVYNRAKGTCENCGVKLGKEINWYNPNGHVHHIIELSKGGNNDLSNLQLLCKSCHSDKHPDNFNLL